jgi:23S rRNA pseudouridine2605 synthase
VSERGERIQKVLARAGVGSRRAVEEMVVAGRIEVNGHAARLGQRVDVTKDRVEVDGSLVPLDPELVYYLLNKPAGIVTTTSDPEGRPTVLDVVDIDARVWPVGRLDLDTEGALVLTNDGELTNRLTHPAYGVTKTYLAEVRGAVKARTLKRLAGGIQLEDGRTAPATVGIVDRMATTTLVEITLTEGRNRQVRRMFDAVGHPIVRLARTAIGPVTLGRLKPGTFRRLSPIEVGALNRVGGGGARTPLVDK